jgi:uncharacterized membrane protein YeiB
MAVAVRESHAQDQPSPPPVGHGGERIVGVDIARGLALIGMFTVHVVVADPDPQKAIPEWMNWWLWAPSGRASVMFMLLAGVSLSIIRRRKKASSTSAAIRKRGLVLLVGGLLLARMLWPASILEHYGMLFLIAPWLLAMRSRPLAGAAATSFVGGPILLLLGSSQSDASLGAVDSEGAVAMIYNTLHDLWLSGHYPLVLWIGVLAVGILVGRLDLGSKRTGLRLAAIGLAIVLVVGASVAVFASVGIKPAGDGSGLTDDASASSSEVDSRATTDLALDATTISSCLAGGNDYSSPGDCIDSHLDQADSIGNQEGDIASASWAELLDTSAHSGRIAWAVESTGIALLVLGLLLLAPTGLTSLLRPLAMLGSISLTAYLVHIAIITDIYQPYVEGSGLGATAQFAALIGLQVLLVLMAVTIRRFWSRGPFEWLIKQLTATAPVGHSAISLPAQVGEDL